MHNEVFLNDRASSVCPLANICELTTEQAPPCGDAPEHFPGVVRAEELCPRALVRQVEVTAREASPTERMYLQSRARTAVAWSTFEHGQSLADPDEAYAQYLKAFELADKAVNHPYAYVKDTVSARMLKIFAPMLVAQKMDQKPTQADIAGVRQGLASAYDLVRNAPIRTSETHDLLTADDTELHQQCFAVEGDRLGLATKVVGMMLAARRGIPLTAASPRETDGTPREQNHDAHLLVGGKKLAVKIRGQVKSQKASGYDEAIVHINIKGLLNQTLDNIRQEAYPVYGMLRHQHNGQLPTILDVGDMLRAEISGQKLDARSLILVDRVAEQFEQSLLEGSEASSIQDLLAAWEILPPAIAKRPYVKATENSKQLEAAEAATTAYLRHGNRSIRPEQLQEYISVLRRIQHPQALVTCAGAYIDLAHLSRANPSEARHMVQAADALTEAFAVKNWKELPVEHAHHLFRTQLQRAYTEKYLKVLSGEIPTLDDEIRLFASLFQAGVQTLRPAEGLPHRTALYDIRGVQFEIAIHLLNARLNVRSGIVHSMWPSTPREDSPHDDVFTVRNAWDALVTQQTFWDYDHASHHLQLKGVDDDKIYDPSVALLSGKRHLGLRDAGEIIRLLVSEMQAASPEEKQEATERLNEIERLYLQRLQETSRALENSRDV